MATRPTTTSGPFTSPSHTPTATPSPAGSTTPSTQLTPRNLSLLPPYSPNSLSTQKRLHVFVASSGRYFEISANGTDSIAALKEQLVQVTNTPAADQILLTKDGTELDGRYTIQHYQSQWTPTDQGCIVFVFNRSDGTQTQRRVPPAPPQPPQIELRLPTDADAVANCTPRPAINSSQSIMIKNLPQFEQFFCKHVLEATAYRHTFAELINYARNQRTQQESVLAALDAACENLDRHTKHMTRNLTNFRTNFTTAATEHHALIDSFQKDLEALKSIEVPAKMRRYVGTLQTSPALESTSAPSPTALSLTPSSAVTPVSPLSLNSISSSRISLFDVIQPSIPLLTRHHEQCTREQGILDRKVEEMMTKYEKVIAKVSSLIGSHRTPEILGPLQNLADMLRSDPSNSFSIDYFDADLKELQKDYNDVVGYVDQFESFLTSRPGESSQLLDLNKAIQNFEDLNTKHGQIIANFQLAYTRLNQGLLPLLAQSASSIQTVFYDLHAKISHISPYVNNVENVIPLNQAALDRVGLLVKSTIQPIHHLPSAWAAVLLELPRRKAFRVAFQKEAQLMSNHIHRLAIEETQRREKFQKEFGAFIPKGQTTAIPNSRPSWSGGFGPLVSQLLERPPILDLSFNDFDSSLPDLDGTGTPTTTNGIPRSASNHTLAPPPLPVIEEMNGDSSSSSSTSPTATTTTTLNSTIATNTALLAKFPWLEQLDKTTKELSNATAKLEAVEKELKELQEFKAEVKARQFAQTISPNSSSNPSTKPTSRRGSTETITTTPSTSSPNQSSRSIPQQPQSVSEMQKLIDDLTKNCAKLENGLKEYEQEKEIRAKLTLKLEEEQKLKQSLEAELEKEREKNKSESQEFARGANRQFLQLKESKAEIGRLQDKINNLDVILQLHANKIAHKSFAVDDMVLFYHNPTRTPPGKNPIDYLEVFTTDPASENYFISEESANNYKQILKARQEHKDAAMAKELQQLSASPGPSSSSSSSSPSMSGVSLSNLPARFEFIGQIVMINRHSADADNNPYQLPIGTIYHTLTVYVAEEPEDKRK